jgi:hypothetical protein
MSGKQDGVALRVLEVKWGIMDTHASIIGKGWWGRNRWDEWFLGRWGREFFLTGGLLEGDGGPSGLKPYVLALWFE